MMEGERRRGGDETLLRGVGANGFALGGDAV